MSDTRSASCSSGLPGMLLVLFIGLKLGHVIDWSWWWVLAPLWGPFVIMASFLLFGAFVIVLIALVPGKRSVGGVRGALDRYQRGIRR